MTELFPIGKFIDSGLKFVARKSLDTRFSSLKNETRFTPEPLPVRKDNVENEDTWGYADTRFEARQNGDVYLTGSRYALSNQRLSSFIPWIQGVMDIQVDPLDMHAWNFPCKIPKPVSNEGFMRHVRDVLKPTEFSEEGVHRLRRGHGHTQEEMYAIKYGKIERIPDLVVWPSEESQVEALVQRAIEHNVVLIPYGGGTNVTEALKCAENETRMIVSVDMKNMNRIRWVDPVNRMAFIEAGAVGGDIQKSLARYGWTMGHEPDSSEFSTLGGWIATNASGMKKNRYGNIEDLVLDVHAITASGKLERSGASPRESIGIDTKQWLFGSEGSLGIITGAVVKLFPVPQVQRYGSVLFKNFNEGVAFLYELNETGNLPASVRLVDNLQFQFGQALKPANEGLKVYKSKLEKAFVTKVKGFDPKEMVACTLVFEGLKDEVDAQEKLVYSLAEKHGGMKGGSENGARGYMLTYSIAYIRDFVMKHWVIAESFETSVSWSQAISLCQNVKKRVADEHSSRGLPGKPFITCRVTQLYETGVAVYFYFAFNYKGVENPSQVYLEIENAARDEILKNGGSLSHHHGVGKLRKAFLPRIMSEAALLWRAKAKSVLDPQSNFGSDSKSVTPSFFNTIETPHDVVPKEDASMRGVRKVPRTSTRPMEQTL